MVAVLPERRLSVTEVDVRHALDAVLDPELDEPITRLGFVHSIVVEGADSPAVPTTVTVHLRLPTSFCAPNFAYLMCADSKDALSDVPGVDQVVVELDDHHDSGLINAGLAADAGYLGTFGHEAERDLDELRTTFRRKAHTAAMERCLTALLRGNPDVPEEAIGKVRLADLPTGRHTQALLRRRAVLGLPTTPDAPVLVDHEGRGYEPVDVPMALRRARATRISIDGNAHFCRGLLRTRYEGSGADQAPRLDGAEPADHHHLLPLSVLPFPAKEHQS
ncbi:iron-sulfur cluster assembly protein [Phycicoccus sp. SLBN-51]|uniref:iron-sulfur cluster assembly protein n=1 Tax=Phycicoccus sp. SLBN-51 TaxID=2768447 RepID=UPI0011516240|nr:iron-sulfur cluster assembly protein [Phycicoccus sp. SLBN-51]TQJ50556.1 metal-sulfur cluster biosynthetic enzyme [Phycicoccus sp. SLBN-51]